MALQRLEMADEKIVAWKKSMRAARCGSGHRAFAPWDSASADGKLIVACGSAACEKFITLAAS